MKNTLLTLVYTIFGALTLNAQIIVDISDSTGYTSIQQAIDNSPVGSIITVKSGEYSENITLKEGITLIGEDSPIIDGGGEGAVVVMADNSNISGFRIKNSGSATGINDAGVRAKNVKNCTINNNIIYNNGHYGVVLDNSDAKVYYNFFLILNQ